MLEFFVACHVSIVILGAILIGLWRENNRKERLLKLAFRLLKSRARI